MPGRLPKYLRMQILSFYFRGLSQGEVARRLGVAQSTVSLEINRFLKESMVSLEAACRNYGVKEYFSSLHYVAERLLEAKLTIPQCLKAFSVVEKLESLGRSIEDLDNVLQLLERQDREVLQAALKLQSLEWQTGKPAPTSRRRGRWRS